jgi:hypothetical protein
VRLTASFRWSSRADCGYPGSLRGGSHNTALLRAAAGLVPDGVSRSCSKGWRRCRRPRRPRPTSRRPRSPLREAPPARTRSGGDAGVQRLRQACSRTRRLASAHRESALWGKTAAVVGLERRHGALWAQPTCARRSVPPAPRCWGGDLPVSRAAGCLRHRRQPDRPGPRRPPVGTPRRCSSWPSRPRSPPEPPPPSARRAPSGGGGILAGSLRRMELGRQCAHAAPTRRTAREPVDRRTLDELFELARYAPNHHLATPGGSACSVRPLAI